MAGSNDGHWQDDNTAVQKKLRVMRSEGVKTITWKADPGACDPCIGNNGQTVRVGQRFKSGASIPPEHDHCGCYWIDDQGHVYSWTGVDGMYKRVEKK